MQSITKRSDNLRNNLIIKNIPINVKQVDPEVSKPINGYHLNYRRRKEMARYR